MEFFGTNDREACSALKSCVVHYKRPKTAENTNRWVQSAPLKMYPTIHRTIMSMQTFIHTPVVHYMHLVHFLGTFLIGRFRRCG